MSYKLISVVTVLRPHTFGHTVQVYIWPPPAVAAVYLLTLNNSSPYGQRGGMSVCDAGGPEGLPR